MLAMSDVCCLKIWNNLMYLIKMYKVFSNDKINKEEKLYT